MKLRINSGDSVNDDVIRLGENVNSILDKEKIYSFQMQRIRDDMFAHMAHLDPTPMRRGRHAHSSALIQQEQFSCIIDIQMDQLVWDQMPDHIPADYPFELWGSAFLKSDRKTVSKNIIFWELPFCEIEACLEKFVILSLEFLKQHNLDGFTTKQRIPSGNPDRIPNLAGPRPAEFIGG